MTHVFHRNPRQRLRRWRVAGKGIELTDSEGRRYLEASGAAAASSIGHGHPRVNEAIKAQSELKQGSRRHFIARRQS